jgi:hypothetical protein
MLIKDPYQGVVRQFTEQLARRTEVRTRFVPWYGGALFLLFLRVYRDTRMKRGVPLNSLRFSRTVPFLFL